MSPAKSNFDTNTLRKIVLQMAYAGNSVHIACAFSIIEILAVLYRVHLRYPANNPNSPFRDYLVLSKGHGVMAQYACLYEKGWIRKTHLDNYFADGTRLKGLSDTHIQGCEVTSGSLGHGLSVALGLALGTKFNNREQHCYVIVGDGEMNEGPCWEALLFAAHWKLDNLIVIVDENGYQAMGKTNDVLKLCSLEKKFESFGFESSVINGHDELILDKTIATLKRRKNGAPKAIIAQTIKGKGVSFMENTNKWHYSRLTKKSFADAMSEQKE